MRKSRVLLAGVAVAAAAVTTSAFTNTNTVQTSIAGYGTATVSGATTAHINYLLDTNDKSLVDSIVFELNGDYTTAVANQGLTAWLRLQNNASPVGAAVGCTFGAAANNLTPVTCAINDTAITSFNGVALTVSE